MQIRDRIREFRRIRADLLRPNPKNWRTHPQAQRDAMCGVLAEIGYADALLARELPDGTFELIDGHLRAETTPQMEVPVLILDLTDDEAAKLLALHDPLAALAGTDEDLLTGLLSEVQTDNDALRSVLDGILAESAPLSSAPSDEGPPPEVDVPEVYQVVVECCDEAEQQTVYERLLGEGLKCRLLML
ncbi:MAG TPA: ParB N-terminal domain-containing protein [Thermoguttaceae bacterium]|nr:ParB N-terminal domain-containing protein [Thermoguttaceae bacterium]